MTEASHNLGQDASERSPEFSGPQQGNAIHQAEERKLAYVDMRSIESGFRFKTRSGLIVETTGVSRHIDTTQVNVHEVVIVEGDGQGEKYLHNLDVAEQV